MQRILLFTATAVLTFAVGLGAQNVSSLLFGRPDDPGDFRPLIEQREDELHRLYEAALVSDDQDLRNEVFGRLICMGPDYALDESMVSRGSSTFCMNADRVEVPLSGVSSSTFATFRKQHREWASNNLPFLTEINSAFKARQYVENHLWL